MSKMRSDHREIELKFEVTDGQMRRLRGKPILRRLGDGRPAKATLRSVYFDTRDQLLRARGMSLRVRRKGDAWIQTAKIGKGVVAGLSTPLEIEFPVDGPSLDIDGLLAADLPSAIRKLLRNAELAPVFETVISRTTRQLRGPDGSHVEIAFDSGTVQAGKATSQIREIELELKDGKPSSLFSLAEELSSGETLRFSEWSKAERGYRLTQGETGAVARPQPYVPPTLEKTAIVRDAFGPQLQACAQQIAHNWRVVLDSDDSEGPHQFRIGLRRLRSVLKAYQPIIRTSQSRQLARAAQHLASVAGQLRDADVLHEDIVSAAAHASSKGIGFADLENLLQGQRERTRTLVREKLSGDETMALLLKLGQIIETPEKQIRRKRDRKRAVTDVACSALNKSWRGSAKWGDRVADLSIPERHEMRKALKKLRYQIDAFGDFYPKKRVKPFRRKLRNLQDVFGYLNDVAMADRLAHTRFLDASDSNNLARAAGFVLGWHTARAEQAWAHAQETWNELRDQGPFWRK